MRYTAVIADDEPKLMQLVRLLGHWEEKNIEIVAECTDGESALKTVLEKKPDFVLSDIKMPGLDGIQLIEEARRAGSSSLFILLSGYREFEYARSAITLNVVDYLLKPVSEVQLNETLDKVCRNIDQMRENSSAISQLNAMKEEEKRLKQTNFWNIMTVPLEKTEYKYFFRDEAACNAKFGMDLTSGFYYYAVTLSTSAAVLNKNSSLFMESAIARMHSLFADCASIHYLSTEIGFFILLNFAPENQKRTEEALNAYYYTLRDLSATYGTFRLSMGISSLKKTLPEVKRAFGEATGAEWYRMIVGASGIYYYDRLRKLPQSEPDRIILPSERAGIAGSIRYLKRDELRVYMSDICKRTAEMAKIAPDAIMQAVSVLRFEVETAAEDGKKTDFSGPFDQALADAISYDQYFRNLYLVLDQWIEARQKELAGKARKPIQDAIGFINLHFPEQISQQDVADYCNVSAAYISRLFKEEMDIGFADYLTQVRMEQAEKLLAETRLSIKEIAMQVGYSDEKYFSKTYKKLNGIKPTEYRKIYG